MIDEQNILRLSIKDFFSAKMLKYSLLPFILTIIVMYLLFFYIAGVSLESLGSMDIHTTQTTIQNGIPHTEITDTKIEGGGIIDYIVNFVATSALVSWLISFSLYAIGGFITLYLSIIVAVIIIGFLTPYVLKEIQRRHYNDVEMIGYSNIFLGLLQVFKWLFVMILLFFLFIPLYFIPIVNIIALNLPLYYFFHKMITYDIASNIVSYEENRLIKFNSANNIRFKTLALYLISLIPFAIFFGAVFYVIYLGHTYFVEVKKIRS